MRSEPKAGPQTARTALTGLLALVVTAPSALAQIPVPEPAQVNPLVPKAVPNPLLPNPLLPNPLLPKPAAPQPQATPKQDPLRPTLEEHKYQGGYSKSRSHELFRACDRNSDDRLDILETTDAFDVLLSAKDYKGFARIDTDRDGFVTWPEFDARFRKGLENGGTFRVRTSRPFVLPDPPPQPLTPLQKFIRLYDKDGDGSLSPTEITDLLKQTGLPTAFAATLLQSDQNNSGSIDEAELAPWFQALNLPTETTASGDSGGLRQPWLDADANSNQMVDKLELDVLLRRVDPALLRWSKQLIAKLDTDKDGKLSAEELAALDPPEEQPDAVKTNPAGTAGKATGTPAGQNPANQKPANQKPGPSNKPAPQR